MAPNFLKSTLIGNFYSCVLRDVARKKGHLLWLSIREPSFYFSFSDQAINIKSLNIERTQQFQLSLKI